MGVTMQDFFILFIDLKKSIVRITMLLYSHTQLLSAANICMLKL